MVERDRDRDLGPQALPGADAVTDKERSRRERILDAALALFSARGYARTQTLDIASRARISKRELYRLFESKEAILAACITRRAAQLRLPLAGPRPHDQRTLVAVLTAFGAAALRELSDPAVVALYRLAIGDAIGDATGDAARPPGVALALDDAGRAATRAALIGLLADAQSSSLLGPGEPAGMAGEFFGLLWGDLQLRIILGVAARPTAPEIAARARAATDALLRLHPAPVTRSPARPAERRSSRGRPAGAPTRPVGEGARRGPVSGRTGRAPRPR
jgi:AcrR family transcriptional regulator